MEKSLFQNVDCVSFFVDDIDAGIDFYSNALGLELLWRAKNSCGLGMPNGVAEVVLVTEHNPIVDFKVECVEDAIPKFIAAGGSVRLGPFDIDIGKCAVVRDKWQNEYCILDMTKGRYAVSDNKDVIGLENPEK